MTVRPHGELSAYGRVNVDRAGRLGVVGVSWTVVRAGLVWGLFRARLRIVATGPGSPCS